MTAPILISAMLRIAEQILSEQRHFELTPQQWDAFCAALDAPAKEIPALKALFKRPSVFSTSPAKKTQTRSSKKSKFRTA
jgi:uncharacterized protein (DUF1778 family)